MLKFDLDDLNPATKCFFEGEEGPDAPWVSLRIADSAAQQDIKKKAVKKCVELKNNPKTNRMERITYTESDDDLYLRLLWDYVITDWNIKDAKGKPIPCTADMKVLLMGKSFVFSNFVTKCLDKLNEAAALEAEESEKNS